MPKTNDYKLKGILPTKQAKVIDFINEFCIGYYINHHDTIPCLQNLDTPIYKKFGVHSIASELIINIMIKEEIITPIYDESEKFIKELDCNSNGFQLYFNGGLTKKIKREKRKAILITLASIASVIVGIYYLVILLKELTNILYPLISN
jgi:hypothetical protein